MGLVFSGNPQTQANRPSRLNTGAASSFVIRIKFEQMGGNHPTAGGHRIAGT